MPISVEQYLDKLSNDLQIDPLFEKIEKKLYTLPFDDRMIKLVETEQGFILSGEVGILPEEEDFSMVLYLLSANYLGQGTGQSALGLKPDGHTITITMDIRSDMSYAEFKEAVEEYVNYFDYWREEIEEKKIRDLK